MPTINPRLPFSHLHSGEEMDREARCLRGARLAGHLNAPVSRLA